MNILFLTLTAIYAVQQHGIYTDLIRKFAQTNHVYALSIQTLETNQKCEVYTEGNVTILACDIDNTRREKNAIKKGFYTLLLGRRIRNLLKRKLKDVHFDLIIYATPPVTFQCVVSYFKKRDSARTYLLLKDIFPQNAVDLGMMKTTGIKGLFYKYFRSKEKKLYAISDHIGCMSQANVDYVLKHNSEIDPSIVEICPNSIEVQDLRLSDEEKLAMREKYGIPTDKKVFVYGGNLGKPQGIPFIIDCLRAEKDNGRSFFLIVGSGTEFGKLEAFVNEEKPANVKLMKSLPKEDYDKMVAACDVGMIFLDHRFTIPNFPSRLLSYMQAGLPVLACTDPNTDIGKVITDGGLGWWCKSNGADHFVQCVDQAMQSDLHSMGTEAFEYLQKYYHVEDSYSRIVKSIE